MRECLREFSCCQIGTTDQIARYAAIVHAQLRPVTGGSGIRGMVGVGRWADAPAELASAGISPRSPPTLTFGGSTCKASNPLRDRQTCRAG